MKIICVDLYRVGLFTRKNNFLGNFGFLNLATGSPAIYVGTLWLLFLILKAFIFFPHKKSAFEFSLNFAMQIF